MLAFLIPIDAMDWQAEYDQLRHEIAAYSAELAQKPHCVVFTKMDLLGEDDASRPSRRPMRSASFAISAAGRTGLDPLLAAWWRRLLGMRKAPSVVREALSFPDASRRCLALALAPGVGPRRYHERTKGFGSAAHAFGATIPAGSQARLRDEAAARHGGRRAVRRTPPADRATLTTPRDSWTSATRRRSCSCSAISRSSRSRRRDRRHAARDGVRRARDHGTRWRARGSGCCVVSGMARGIDARRASRRAGRERRTVAVLGTGVDVAYPRGAPRRCIARSRSADCALGVSLGAGARAGSFPRRNRIIAALARVTIVVEAGDASGALITADHAHRAGRDVAPCPDRSIRRRVSGRTSSFATACRSRSPRSDALALVGLRDPATPRDISPDAAGRRARDLDGARRRATPIDQLTERAECSRRAGRSRP